MYSYVLSKRLRRKGNIGGIKLDDIAFVVAMIAVAGLGYLTLTNLGAFQVYAMVISGIIVAISLLLVMPGKYEENMLIKYGRYRRFKNEQQRYLFRRGT